MAAGRTVLSRFVAGQASCALPTLVSLVAGAELSAYSAATRIPIAIGTLGLVPLFVAVRVYRPVRASLCAALWGVLLYVQLAVWGSVEVDVASCVVFALAPAMHGAAGSWWTRHGGFSPLALGVGWIGVECAFSAAGLPRGLFAGAPEEAAILGAMAHGLGIMFVGFVAAYFSAILVSALGVAVVPGAPDRIRPRAASEFIVALAPQQIAVVGRPSLCASGPRAPPFSCLS